MWLACVGWRARAVDARHDALAGLQVALAPAPHDGLVVAERGRRRPRAAAVAVLALEMPWSDTWPPPVGVERRLGELDSVRPSSRRRQPSPSCARSSVLVAVNGRRARRLANAAARSRRSRRRAGLRATARAAPPSAPRSPPVQTPSPRSPAISRVRSIGKPNVSCSRKAVGADPLAPASRARAIVVEQLARPARACARSPPPRRASHCRSYSRCRCSSGRRAPISLEHRLDVAGQEAELDADAVALQDRAAHDPAQDVAAVLVGGHDAVGDQEGHAARVVGQDAQRAVVRARRRAPQLRARAASAAGTGRSRRPSRRPAGSAPCG